MREKRITVYKAFIFDLDGTLADTVESIAYSANAAIEKVGLKGNPAEEYKKYAGDGAAEMLRRSLKAAGDAELKYFEQVEAYYKEIFLEHCLYKVTPYKGIREMLEELKAAGIKIAVLSNKPHERTLDVVEGLFGKGYFHTIQGQTPEIERKPSPLGAYKIRDFFGIVSEECVYVGDTDTDMITGKSGKMYTVGVTWGFRDRQELKEYGADKIIDHPKELLDLI